jgi:prepilin-type N-terminal cleavage/methylation domain-containing protein
MQKRPAFTLVELLVVIAIIGILVALTLPAIQSAREATRRTQCLNNLHQLGIALTNYESTNKHFPVGSESKAWAAAPGHAHTFYRWSALAHLTPYLENTAIYKSLDLSIPLYTDNNYQIAEVNKRAVATLVPELLCPSDSRQAVATGFGPSNYMTSTGSGTDGGSPFDTNGLFYINSQVKIKQITDGLSTTIAFSESLLGTGPESFADRRLANNQTTYVFLPSIVPITESARDAGTIFNFTNRRNFSWANGEYRTTLYNHYYTPNSDQIDCISQLFGGTDDKRFTSYGWHGARSNHVAGVNVIRADGSGHYVTDDIDPAIWRAMATRAGGEVK